VYAESGRRQLTVRATGLRRDGHEAHSDRGTPEDKLHPGSRRASWACSAVTRPQFTAIVDGARLGTRQGIGSSEPWWTQT